VEEKKCYLALMKKPFQKSVEHATVVYISNLTFEKDEVGLRNLFKPFGRVKNVKIVKDLAKDVSKGFAFVTMTNKKEAAAAIKALNGAHVDGRTVKASEAIPQDKSLKQAVREVEQTAPKKKEIRIEKANQKPKFGLAVLFENTRKRS